MHELGLLYQVIKSVDSVKASEGLTEIDTITLEVGEMSDVVPSYLVEAWESARLASDYPAARLELEIIKARARCKSCGHTDLVENLGFECPKCNSINFEIISGREFNIKSIVAK